MIRAKQIYTVPNQKIVQVIQDEFCGKETYGIITRTMEQIVARLLNEKSASPILLYYHIALNQNGYEFALSPKAIEYNIGLTYKQYQYAVKRLVEEEFLVRKEKGSNIWYFYRVPLKWRNVNVLDMDTKEVSIPTGGDSSNLPNEIDTVIDCIPLQGETSTPTGGEATTLQGETRVPLQGERNNTIYYNNNTYNTVSSIINNDLFSDDEIIQKEKDLLVEFGYLDKSKDELSRIKNTAINKNKGIAWYKTQIDELIKDFAQKRAERIKFAHWRQKSIIDRTLPKNAWERIKVGLILDKYRLTHNVSDKFYAEEKNSSKNGAWINGWDEETQEPNVTSALYAMPPEIISKQKHNIGGVPLEYYKQR